MDVSSVSGPPPPIRSFDWSNLYHKTSLVSCLVEGVYAMEKDRQKKHRGPNSLATPWYESFGFILDKQLIDIADDSIYAAVFKNGNEYQNSPNSEVPPRYVIAFRGTIFKPKTIIGDVEHNIRCSVECLHRGSKFVQAIQEIECIVKIHGHKAVWLTGHSLGASLALLVGKRMAMCESPVEAFIFNPVISLLHIEQNIKNEHLKFGIRLGMDIFKASIASIAIALDRNKDDQEGHHRDKNLASWRPNLFVNPLDPFCAEYIGYFKHRVKMAELGSILHRIERRATRYSVRAMLFMGGENPSPEYLHYLPSALMMVNKTDFEKCHGISQWWNPKLSEQSTYSLYY